MIAVSIIAAVAIITLAAVIWMQDRSHRDDRHRWVEERRELLNRIQRPELAPYTTPTSFEAPELPADEWAQVGTIRNDPEAYLGFNEGS